MIAAQNGNEELVRFLVAKGADISLISDKRTAEGYASTQNIRNFLAEPRRENEAKINEDRVKQVKAWCSGLLNVVTFGMLPRGTTTNLKPQEDILRIFSLPLEGQLTTTVIRKHTKAYNALKIGRSVKELTQAEALTVIYKVAAETKKKTTEKVLSTIKKLSGEQKTTLVQAVENTVFSGLTPLE